MKLIIKKENILDYSFNNEIIVTVYKKLIKVENLEFDFIHEKHISNTVISICNFYDNILFQLSDEENIYIINKKDIELKLSNHILIGKIIDSDFIYIEDSYDLISKFNKELEKLCSYSIKGRNPTFIYSKYYFRFPNNSIFCYEINNNIQIWQQSFKDLLQSEEVLLRYYYAYQEKLILHLRTNGLPQNKYVTVVLDVNTGKELYRTEETLGKKLINGLGYTLYDQILWISNPETYDVKRIDLSEILSPLNKIIDDKIGDVDLGKTEVKFRFSLDYFTVEYPYLYFSEQRGLQLGALNIETKELIFHTEIEEKGLVKDLKSSNGKIFVHTTENNLYVFG